MNALQSLRKLGQSVWYDNISRDIIGRGDLAAMVAEGLLGVTSNPTIFDKAISGSDQYDDQIREILASDRTVTVDTIIQELMVRDIQMAADVLAPVFAATAGGDGYVSIEVTPGKARDTSATIEEVRHLWSRVDRPNLMVKIPATREGLPAIEEAIAGGININVTLIFSVTRYREVFQTYMRGLERRLEQKLPIDRVASVASVFVSRVDTLVDPMLEQKARTSGAAGKRLEALKGTAAVANAKMVYAAFQELSGSARFGALAARGARLQRPLWGSTGTKNPAYSDLLYVQTLVGPETVNTVPPQTYRAILDHLQPSRTVDQDMAHARGVLAEITAAGIDLDSVMTKLEEDGVAAFERSFDGLYQNLRSRRDALLHDTAAKK
jgi:transaldolase